MPKVFELFIEIGQIIFWPKGEFIQPNIRASRCVRVIIRVEFSTLSA